MRREVRRQKTDARSKKNDVGKWKWVAVYALLAALPAWGQLLPTFPQVSAGGAVSGGPMQEPPPPRWPERDRSKGVPLVISPQAPAKPALQYALLLRIEETEKGNAAVKYLIGSTEMPKNSGEDTDLLDMARRDAPLAELNEAEPAFQKIISNYSYPMRMLKEGAALDHVDWEYDIRAQGFRAMLPSLGNLRHMAGVLALEIRFDIKRHDWAAAREKLTAGYGLAGHMARGDLVIESLVGVAVASIMNQTLEDWIAEPGSPNLYWPLTNLPAPFTDIPRGLEFERAEMFFSFPQLKEIKQGHYSPDLWRGLTGGFYEFSMATSFAPDPMRGTLSPALTRQLGTAALGMLMYPQAKDFLLHRGMSREEVEKMPPSEALERFCLRSWEEAMDDMNKWAGVPGKEGLDGMLQAERELETRRATGDENWFVTMFMPSLGRARYLAARTDRQIAALRIVEAIRAYAAEKGALPENLAALKLPVPPDPIRSAPFVYELKDGKAVVSSPAATPREGLRYELTLRK